MSKNFLIRIQLTAPTIGIRKKYNAKTNFLKEISVGLIFILFPFIVTSVVKR